MAELYRDTEPGQLQTKIAEFDRAQAAALAAHAPVELDGYARREFTLGGAVPLAEAEAALAAAQAEHGLAGCAAYAHRPAGHSTALRFFPDGKAWLAAGCAQSDLGPAGQKRSLSQRQKLALS